MSSEAKVFLINGIFGLPILIFSLYYFKLRVKYFQKENLNDISFIKKVFTPALIQKENIEASNLNTYTKWFWVACITYGIIMAVTTEYFIFK